MQNSRRHQAERTGDTGAGVGVMQLDPAAPEHFGVGRAVMTPILMAAQRLDTCAGARDARPWYEWG